MPQEPLHSRPRVTDINLADVLSRGQSTDSEPGHARNRTRFALIDSRAAWKSSPADVTIVGSLRLGLHSTQPRRRPESDNDCHSISAFKLSIVQGGSRSFMRLMRYIFKDYHRSARTIVMLGVITVAGCGSGDNVLEPPEGGAPADQAKVNTPKPNPKISSRQDREKAPQQ